MAPRLETKDLHGTFEYNFVSGGLYRKIPVRGSQVGARFGGCYKNKTGSNYIRGKFNGKDAFEHGLIWEYFYGSSDDGLEIDHINHDGLDNRIINLRLVTTQENNKNKPLVSTNKSGISGVHFCKKSKKWNAQIKVGGTSINLGYYENIGDAEKARGIALKTHNFHPNHGLEI